MTPADTYDHRDQQRYSVRRDLLDPAQIDEDISPLAKTVQFAKEADALVGVISQRKQFRRVKPDRRPMACGVDRPGSFGFRRARFANLLVVKNPSGKG
jgi:hypothetical protein